jgi:hypothetical protein
MRGLLRRTALLGCAVLLAGCAFSQASANDRVYCEYLELNAGTTRYAYAGPGRGFLPDDPRLRAIVLSGVNLDQRDAQLLDEAFKRCRELRLLR